MAIDLLNLPTEIHLLMADYLYDDEYITRRLNGTAIEWHTLFLPDSQ